MRTVILETFDGWQKKMAIPAKQREVRIPIRMRREGARVDADRFEIASDNYYVARFEWDGAATQEEVDRFGHHWRIEVWGER